MMAKIFPKGKGGIQYMLSKEYARTILGDAKMTQKVIDSSTSVNPSTAGVLTFEEHITDPEELKRVCQDFERNFLCPGINPDEYSVVWVEHQEKAKGGGIRTGAHFEMANTHLPTQNRIQPYWHAKDKSRKMAWQALTNEREGYSDPDSLDRKQVLSFTQNLPKLVKEQREVITEAITDGVIDGTITNHEDVKDFLMEMGLTITRTTGKSISVKVDDEKRALRLTGTIYEPEFTTAEETSIENERRTKERLQRHRERFERDTEKVRSDNAKAYPSRILDPDSDDLGKLSSYSNPISLAPIYPEPEPEQTQPHTDNERNRHTPTAILDGISQRSRRTNLFITEIFKRITGRLSPTEAASGATDAVSRTTEEYAPAAYGLSEALQRKHRQDPQTPKRGLER